MAALIIAQPRQSANELLLLWMLPPAIVALGRAGVNLGGAGGDSFLRLRSVHLWGGQVQALPTALVLPQVPGGRRRAPRPAAASQGAMAASVEAA